ncbi:hypothetical protein [Edwardsiella tarda]|nr:hypothetical protein [Edwardsiella tarda]WKS82684.1 hypothetical protein NHU85_08000 [Edwardsiella tarda]
MSLLQIKTGCDDTAEDQQQQQQFEAIVTKHSDTLMVRAGDDIMVED